MGDSDSNLPRLNPDQLWPPVPPLVQQAPIPIVTGFEDFLQQGGSSRGMMGTSYVMDPYQKTDDMKEKFREVTIYCYVPSFQHHSLWDEGHPETPLRAAYIDNQLKALPPVFFTIDRSRMIEIDDMELLSLVHEPTYIEHLEQICIAADKVIASQYDSVFFSGQKSYDCAVEAVKMTTTMARLIATGEYQNGLANVRPPGHHACTQPNGYCLLNNVAIAAKYLIREKLAERILIVDIDVHHGQGTQQVFYSTNEVLYISIHRYEHGLFWPNLRESNFDFIGEKGGVGYNVNIPLNETGLNDTDYMAILFNVILPLAYEFCPSMIIVSGGYDACIGCPEGRMNVTPAFYAHMVSLLSGLAEGKVLVVLEGGYFLPSLSEGAFQTMRALANFRCPPVENMKRINPSVIETINDVKVALRSYWKCFRETDPVCTVHDVSDYDRYRQHVAVVKYYENKPTPDDSEEQEYPVNTFRETKLFLAKLQYLKETYKCSENITVAVSFNTEAYRHSPNELDRAQEVPRRLDIIKRKFEEFDLSSRMVEFVLDRDDQTYKTAFDYAAEYIQKTHSADYLDLLKGVGPEPKPDLYWTQDSYSVCQESCALLIHLVMNVKSAAINHGIAVIRPPGHHAKRSQAGGFCLINNVGVAAKFALEHGFRKVLIVDFDVHHGDGTQDITYDNEDILYISMHRYDEARFFPKDFKGNYDFVGEGPAAGFNVNVAFENAKLGDADYLFTWMKLVLPLAYSFSPDLILVSAGFDAGVSDPLGGYKVHPETFGHMVHTLRALGPVVLSLEGGYNLETTSLSMVNCARALIGEPLPTPSMDNIDHQTITAVQKTIKALKPYWPVLEVNKALDPTIRFGDSVQED